MRARTLSSSRSPAPPRVGRWTFSAVLCGLALLLTGSCAQNTTMIDGLAASAAVSATTQPADPITTKREARAAPREEAGKRIDNAFAVPEPGVSKKSGDRLKPAFRPALARMLKPDVFGDPGRFQEPGAAEQVPEGGLPDIAAGPLSRFYAKLAALENGQRSEPVTILHIGDSHVAAGFITVTDGASALAQAPQTTAAVEAEVIKRDDRDHRRRRDRSCRSGGCPTPRRSRRRRTSRGGSS